MSRVYMPMIWSERVIHVCWWKSDGEIEVPFWFSLDPGRQDFEPSRVPPNFLDGRPGAHFFHNLRCVSCKWMRTPI
jgi:hypothetical protein